MIYFFINIFFIYSFLGFLFENGIKFFINSQFNSGILYGPWAFIYGIAIFVIMILNKFLRQFKLPKWLEIVIFYIAVTILMTLIEFSGGMLIEKLFHEVYWDYTNLTYNYGHYIALEISLLWGVFATFINYVVSPLLEKFAKKIPKIITIILIVLFITDIIVTSIS